MNQESITSEIKSNPENFSPNVILRPLYQESILPNVAYIGGGGELSYWMQLKTMFDSVEVPFPILILRSSFLMIKDKEWQKWITTLRPQI